MKFASMGLAAVSNRARSPRVKPQDGFTLLEVLVAIVLLGFSYAGILNALSQGLKLARAAADQENAIVLAQSLLEENRALPKAEIVGSDRRDAFGGTQYGYKVEVRDVPLFADVPADKLKPTFELKQISVDVYWGEREPKRHYRLSTFQTVPLSAEEAAAKANEPAKPGTAPPGTQTPGSPAPNTPAKPDEKKP